MSHPTLQPFTFTALVALALTACKESSPSGSSSSSSPPTPPPVHLPTENGMILVPGGTYTRGSTGKILTAFGEKDFPEEAPISQVTVPAFWIDQTEVTNAQFRDFVKATGYQTFAEREVTAEDFPAPARGELPKGPLHNGSIVFRADAHIEGDPNVPGRLIEWWRWDPDANWQHPQGKNSSIDGMDQHPVVCITHEDATAYAKWAGKRLPSEAEWEFAARGGREGQLYSWGNELQPNGKWMANIWQGKFPNENTGEDGFTSYSPVKSFPANDYGLYDMAGNVWEMCSDLYDPHYFTYCDPKNPKGPETWINRDTGRRGEGTVHRVTKGGSYLCHESYCMRYRPAARHSMDSESPTNHIGFRCVRDVNPTPP